MKHSEQQTISHPVTECYLISANLQLHWTMHWADSVWATLGESVSWQVESHRFIFGMDIGDRYVIPHRSYAHCSYDTAHWSYAPAQSDWPDSISNYSKVIDKVVRKHYLQNFLHTTTTTHHNPVNIVWTFFCCCFSCGQIWGCEYDFITAQFILFAG